MSLIDIQSRKKKPNKNQHSRRSLTIKSNRISTRAKYKKKNTTPSNNIIIDLPPGNSRQPDKSIITCQNCESSYLVNNKSAHKWMCTKCNIIISNAFPNIYNNQNSYNNLQEGIVPENMNEANKLVLKDSFSPSTEDQMGCVIIDSDDDNEMEYNSDDISGIEDINQFNNNHLNNNHLNCNSLNYRRNISRTVSLCEMDSVSSLSGFDNKINKYNHLQIDIHGNKNRHKRRTHLSPNKIGINKIRKIPSLPKSESISQEWVFTQEYEDTYYDDDNKNNKLQLQFDDEYSMSESSDIQNSQTQSEHDSIIANYSQSPSMKTYSEQKRNFAIIRTQSCNYNTPHKPKKIKSKNAKWTPPLNILSEMHTWSEQNPNKRKENPLSKQKGHHSENAIVNANNKNNNNNNNHINNEQYGYKLKPSEAMACDISDCERAYEEYVNGEYGLKSPFSNINSTPTYNNSNGNSTSSYKVGKKNKSNALLSPYSNTNSTTTYKVSSTNNNGLISPYSNITSTPTYNPQVESPNIFDKVSKSVKPFSYYSNLYKYNPEVQRALQVAYLTGFNEGYMGGAAFKLSGMPQQPFK